MLKRQFKKFLALSTVLLFSSNLSAQLTPRSTSALSNLDGSVAQNRPLPLTEAFPYFLSVGSDNTFSVTWTPAPGHYLYRHMFSFSLLVNSEAEPRALDFTVPDGLKKTDQFFGDIEAYYNEVKAEIQLETAPGTQTSLVVEYQGCADWGFCYPPQRVSLPFSP